MKIGVFVFAAASVGMLSACGGSSSSGNPTEPVEVPSNNNGNQSGGGVANNNTVFDGLDPEIDFATQRVLSDGGEFTVTDYTDREFSSQKYNSNGELEEVIIVISDFGGKFSIRTEEGDFREFERAGRIQYRGVVDGELVNATLLTPSLGTGHGSFSGSGISGRFGFEVPLENRPTGKAFYTGSTSGRIGFTEGGEREDYLLFSRGGDLEIDFTSGVVEGRLFEMETGLLAEKRVGERQFPVSINIQVAGDIINGRVTPRGIVGETTLEVDYRLLSENLDPVVTVTDSAFEGRIFDGVPNPSVYGSMFAQADYVRRESFQEATSPTTVSGEIDFEGTFGYIEQFRVD